MVHGFKNELPQTTERGIQLCGGSKIEKYKAIVADTDVISVMKKSYKPFHNQDFTELVKEMSMVSGFELVGFNQLYDGRIVLGHLKNNLENFKIGDHKIDDYIVLGNSHDGSRPLFLGTTTLLVRCQNQFSSISNIESIRHTKSATEKIQGLVEAFTMYLNIRRNMYQNFEKFQSVKVDQQVKDLVLRKLLDIKDEETLEDLSTRKQNQYDLIDNRIISEMEDLGQNLWGMFNGITKFTSHDLKNDNSGFGNLFGTSAGINQKAYSTMLKLAA